MAAVLWSSESDTLKFVECLISDFFACNVLDVRLSSAHCKQNQCYHVSEVKCNHLKKKRLGLKSESIHEEIQVKKKLQILTFKNRNY